MLVPEKRSEPAHEKVRMLHLWCRPSGPVPRGLGREPVRHRHVAVEHHHVASLGSQGQRRDEAGDPGSHDQDILFHDQPASVNRTQLVGTNFTTPQRRALRKGAARA
jgi:hypothetical protein